MSYSRPDETWGYEPPEAPGAAEGAAWGDAYAGTADAADERGGPAYPGPDAPPSRSERRRAAARSGETPSGSTGAYRTTGPGGAEDHTLPPPSPALLHRLPAVAATIVISAGLVLGAQMERPVYAAGIAVLQLAMVGLVTWVRRIEGAWVPLAVAALLAIAADAAAVVWTPVSLVPITVLLALAFGVAVAAQLVRRTHVGVTENLGFTMLLGLAVCGYACYIALSRLGSAPPAMYSAVVAAGTAILAARAVDLVMPDPRINRQVTRGAFGIVIGTMCGTASAAYAGLVIEGPDPTHAAVGGLLIALTAVLADLACGYMSASRRIDGAGTAPNPVVSAAGPLLAFAITGPVVYLLSAYYMID
ncbi:hypothetical protein [Glycomyces tritici]|uniref:Phosphatidate cytidylyltransferase n=1 Tax=Glycomyces tritici TaxID=2665176 RepID=A0ABT7YXK2_9ACTN|nr:hypothetical protein [Glycomyces tritici]MDN3243361.1 hypothetical protein [Glycomyces tritici]MDN3243762.1 hypothetical protein [Glycomyces tritici]